jgi:hypothetical protein
MKKLLMALAVVGLLVGCAHRGERGGTSDTSNSSTGTNSSSLSVSNNASAPQ